MKNFEIIDISGDVGIRAFGASLEDVFKNSAIGMYSLITDLKSIDGKNTIAVSVESHSLEGLLVSWLNELIFHFDAYNFIGKEIDIRKMDDKKIEAGIFGEEFDAERHESKLLIKAATYHRLKIEEKNGIWKAEVVFDI